MKKYLDMTFRYYMKPLDVSEIYKSCFKSCSVILYFIHCY